MSLQQQLRLELITIQRESMHKNKNLVIFFVLFFLIFTTQTNISLKVVDLTDFYILCHANTLYI